MGYVDELFPQDLSPGTSGGFLWDIKTVKTDSDQIFKQIRNEMPRAVFNARIDLRSQEQLDLVRDHYLAVGPGNTFPFQWYQDYTSATNHRDDPAKGDVVIGTGDGSNRRFQLFKKYTYGSQTRTRTITRVEPGTLIVAVNNTVVTEYTESLGEILFDEGSSEIPGALATVTAGFGHYYEVSYDQTEGQPVNFQLQAYTAGRVSGDLVLIEHKTPIQAPSIFEERGHVEHGSISTDISIAVQDGHYHTFTATAALNVIVPDPNALPAGGHHFTIKNKGGQVASVVAQNDLATTIKEISTVGDSWTKLAISRDATTGVQTWEAHSGL